jgi:hypothetical protein
MKTRGEFSQMIEEETIVVLGKKTGLQIVSALDDVDRQPGYQAACATRFLRLGRS